MRKRLGELVISALVAGWLVAFLATIVGVTSLFRLINAAHHLEGVTAFHYLAISGLIWALFIVFHYITRQIFHDEGWNG